MNLIFNNHSNYEKKREVIPTEYGKNKCGCWAYVTAVHSDSLTVDVENYNGFKFYYVPVASMEWVNKDGGRGERNLPPVGSRVFILMPTGTVQGGFVLCSGFSFNSVKEKEDFKAINDDDIEKFNNSKKRISNSGWTLEENLENGNIILSNKEQSIALQIINADDSENDTKKQVLLNAFDTSVFIDAENGISITDKNSNSIKFNSDGVSITDKNSNSINTTSSGIEIKDKNNNKIVSSSTSVTINEALEVLQ